MCFSKGENHSKIAKHITPPLYTTARWDGLKVCYKAEIIKIWSYRCKIVDSNKQSKYSCACCPSPDSHVIQECVTFMKYAFYLATANSRSVVRIFQACFSQVVLPQQRATVPFPPLATLPGSISWGRPGTLENWLLPNLPPKKSRGNMGHGQNQEILSGPLAAWSLCLQVLWLKQAALV